MSELNKALMILPDHITASLEPQILKPKELGKLILTYNPIEKNDFGFVSDNIVLDSSSEQSLSVMAIIEEYFPEMTAEELDEAPKLTISNRVVEFGEVKSGEVVEASFELSNMGKSKLALRAIKANCECITYKIKNKYLKKGKTQTLKLMFDTSDVRGNQYKSITIYSNDPVNPVQLITIKGKVEK